ncbi:MAG: Tn3 family transposase, partial [Anaerolineales bacterium]|nr:Tn3 family transposase [Anaerolineales bacterium]
RIGRGLLDSQVEAVDSYWAGTHHHPFHLVQRRFYYLRQFTPALLEHIHCQAEDDAKSPLVEAVDLQRELNDTNKRKLPEDAPMGFIKRSLRPFVEENGEVSKRAWECALLLAIRDEIRAGNIYIQDSKRFGRFDNFFIADSQWQSRRNGFFERAGLPVKADDVPAYLTRRLDEAYDAFLGGLPENAFASLDENGWHLSIDPGEKLGAAEAQHLDDLQQWLGDNLRVIKLPELLIEVDNDLHFTHQFMTSGQQGQREANYVCQILATVMAYGCNIGPYTMARLTDGATYREIRHITDWQLTEDAQRQALAQLVNAISNLDVTQVWGEGKSSSSDGQRFRLRRKML